MVHRLNTLKDRESQRELQDEKPKHIIENKSRSTKEYIGDSNQGGQQKKEDEDEEKQNEMTSKTSTLRSEFNETIRTNETQKPATTEMVNLKSNSSEDNDAKLKVDEAQELTTEKVDASITYLEPLKIRFNERGKHHFYIRL
eukprot:UN33985